MNHLTIIFLLLITTVLVGCSNQMSVNEENNPIVDIKLARLKAKEAFDFCKSEDINTDFCILIDMSLHSGVKRFFLWDYKKDTISYGCLVSHGCGDNPWSNDLSKENPKFSNQPGSHCSSLGKYIIGERGYSDWGVHIKYVLYGLEASNNNALSRIIVFHSWEAVADKEIYPKGTPEGWGCPAISNNSFTIIDPILTASELPVLMWIYN